MIDGRMTHRYNLGTYFYLFLLRKSIPFSEFEFLSTLLFFSVHFSREFHAQSIFAIFLFTKWKQETQHAHTRLLKSFLNWYLRKKEKQSFPGNT